MKLRSVLDVVGKWREECQEKGREDGLFSYPHLRVFGRWANMRNSLPLHAKDADSLNSEEMKLRRE